MCYINFAIAMVGYQLLMHTAPDGDDKGPVVAEALCLDYTIKFQPIHSLSLDI